MQIESGTENLLPPEHVTAAFAQSAPFVRVVVGVVAALCVAACAPSEEDVQAEFNDFLSSRDNCESADQCVLVSTECPLGCYHAVNATYATAVERKARELVDDYQSAGRGCAYSCIRVHGAVCEAGSCVIAPEPDAGQP
jgi:hypothetical protein